MQPLRKIRFDGEPDLVHVRRVARRLAQLLRFDHRDEVKITAAVSELTRAASAAGGAVEIWFGVDQRSIARWLVVEVSTPGLAAASRERGTATAEGVLAAEKLLERLGESSTLDALRFGKTLPNHVPELTEDRWSALAAELERMDPRQRVELSREELVRQSDELTEALLDLEDRNQELATLNSELNDTNRGVVALYAELDERAGHLRRAGELKTRFFSQISHEFRTPLNSILALSAMLLEESDGPLVPEQRRQVSLIRDGVADLLELVSDLLDLAKMEAGKAQLSVDEFTVGTLFGALRAMIRPLLGNAEVALEFAGVAGLPPLTTDEAKVTQILRNFLSNAAKFTEHGTITVTARLVGPGDAVGGGRSPADESILFSVRDTGIGIAPEHHATIFEEFQQVDSRLQRKTRGTGLGLPLCRRLAGLLGGRIWVESELGRGATFHLLVPRVHVAAMQEAETPVVHPRLLIVDERADRRAELGSAFRDSVFFPVEMSTHEVTPASVAAVAPAAAIVDMANAGTAALEALRAAAVPMVAVPRDAAARGTELVADTYGSILRSKLRCLLVIDDDEAYRTILSRHLAPFCERVEVTGDPRAGISAARGGQVDCLVIDVMMPEQDGLTVLTQIRAEPVTAHLPVVLCSSRTLSVDEQALARRLHAPFLPKDGLTAERIARALLEAQRPLMAVPNEMTRGAA